MNKITILLSEYSTLRSEIVSRSGYGFQIASIGFAFVAWIGTSLASSEPVSSSWLLWLLLIIIIVGFVIGTFVNVRDITRAGIRVRELEHEVNSRAGEHLLIWETLGGVLAQMSIWRSFLSFVKPLPRSRLPPLDDAYRSSSPRSDRV